MATSGGIVSIIFEADTSKIEKAFSDIEKKASKINVGPINAETKRLTAETAKLNAQFKKAHPEIAKIEAETKKIAEESKTAQLKITEAARKNIEKIKENGKTERKQIEENTKLKLQSIKDTEKASTAANKKAAKDSKEALYVYSKYSAEKETDQQLARETRNDNRNTKQLTYEDNTRKAIEKAKAEEEALEKQKALEAELLEYDKREAEYQEQRAKFLAEGKRQEEEIINAHKAKEQEYAKLFKEDEERRKKELNDNIKNAKIKMANEEQLRREEKKDEQDREKALKYEQQLRLTIDKAKRAQALQAQKDAEKARKAAEKAEKDAAREEQSRIKTVAHQFYAIKDATKLIAEGFQNINDGIKSALSVTVSWAKAMLTVINPVKVLTFNFLKSSGVLAKIKQYLSPRSLIEFGKGAVTAASDLTEVQNIVETAFPNMTSQMNEWAENSIDYFGLSEKSAKEYASTLGLMAQSAGIAEKASYKLGTGLTAVTADLASIYNMNQQDVYEKIRSGVIGGRTAAIAQLGINMNQANLQAYMASKGMAEKYSTLDNATKTAIRYNYVLEQTKKIQGDFIKTQGTWANQTRILSESITQLKSSIGTFLVSVLTPLLQRLNQLIRLLIIGVDKLKGILNILGIQIQTAASQSSSGISDLTDDLYENADAADAANKAAAKLTDGPFSEMHKLSGDDGEGNKLAGIFGGADGLMDLENPYELKTLNTLEEYLNRLKSKLNLGELKIAGIEVLKDIKDWIDGIKKAWKDAWNKDDRGTKYLQSVVDLVTEILKLVDSISDAFLNMWNAGWGERLFGHMLETATLINNTVKDIVKSIREAWNTGSGHYGFVAKTDDEKAYENIGKKANGSGVGVRQFTSYSMGGFTDTKAMENTDKVYRELTWGEYFAEQFYKANDAVLTFIDSLTKFIAKINENINWEKILEGWANAIGKFADTLDRLSQWLEDHPEVATKIGELITRIASNPEGIFKTIIAINLLKGTLAGLPKILMGAFVLKNIGLGSFIGSIGNMITNGFKNLFINLPLQLAGFVKNFATTIWSDLIAAFQGAFEMNGLLGGLVDIAVLGAGIFELVSIIINFLTKGIPILWDWIKRSVAGFFTTLGEILLQLWEGDIIGALGTALNSILTWLKDTADTLLIDIPKVLTGPITKLFSDFVLGIIDKIKDLVGWVKDAIDWLGKLINKQGSVESKSKFNGSSGAAWVQHAQIGNYAKVRFNANGGAYKPNDPQLRVIGDSSQHEYDLTESHLDNIANRMTGAVINGFMRVSSMNTGSKGNTQPIINIQMGDEQFKDFIVRTIEENGYRFA